MQRTRLQLLLLCVVSLCWLLSQSACSPSGPDADGDGIADDGDACPETPAGRPTDSAGCSDVERALARAVDAMLVDSSFEVGDLWVAQRFVESHPDERLEAFVKRQVAALEPDPFVRQVDFYRPKTQLPEDPGQGLKRFYNYVLAPFGLPERRARAFIQDFVRRPAQSYVLSHQLLVMLWAEEQQLELPEEVERQRPRILERIAAEQAAASGFSDLFAERAALLIRYGQPEPSEVERWIDILLQAQLEDGGWEDTAQTTFEFDGEGAKSWRNRAHTTTWASLALVSYLEQRRGPRA